MRVYQVAEEHQVSNRVLVQMLQDRGVAVRSHMAPVAEDDVAVLEEVVAEIRKDMPSPAPESATKAPAAEELPQEVAEAAPTAPPLEAEEPHVAAEPAASPEKTEEAPQHKHVTFKEDLSELVEKPAKPAGKRVRKIQEREMIEQELKDMEEEEKSPPEAPKELSRPGPERTRTYRFHKRGSPKTLRRKSKGPQPPTLPTGPVDIVLPASVKDLSQALGVKVADILGVLLRNGVRANINARLDQDTVDILPLVFGREVNIKRQVAVEEAFMSDVEEEDRPEDLEERAPIVAMLGHVDHGKTSLLDYIRRSDVAAKESGGITQHISSYKVTTEEGHSVVFIDLPGHEAFTEMRGRGAKVTDVVVLVIAAEEGVMPQTIESINHAKAAGVPVIVALNKCDKPEANPQKVKQQLTAYDLVAEEWGGDTQMVETSAVSGNGVSDLLEAISLQAEVMELKANPHKKAIGTVLEAEKSEGRGVLAVVVVQEGTLTTGDVVLAGTGFGRVRDIRDDKGEAVERAGPSTPVEITGLSDVPEAGDRFYVVENLGQAKNVAEERSKKQRAESLAEKSSLSLTDLFRKASETETREVPIIVKADTKGSVEAIASKLLSLATAEVKIKILHSAVGSVNESDVQLASASSALIVAFNVMAEDRARSLATEKGVDIRFYEIIYELIDDVRSAMEAELAPEEREVLLGHAEVRQVFPSSKLGNIAGCYVTDGVVRRNAKARLMRAGKVVYDRSHIQSLKRFKEDAREVREGFECGIRLSGYDDVEQGDVIEAFEIQEFRRTLSDVAAPSETEAS